MSSDHNERRRDSRFVAVLAVAASIVGLLNDFVYDDIAIIRDNVRVHSLAHWRDILTLPFWPPPFVEQLYRPLTVLLLAIEYWLGQGSPLVFRLVSCALYAACAIAVFRLASRLLSRRTAFAAAAVFAVHPVHVEAVALGVGQGELIVGMAAVLMVIRYLDARRVGWLTTRDWIALAALFVIAALAKENGFVLPALLVVTEYFRLDDAPLRARIRKLWAGYVAVAIVSAALLVLRSVMLSDGALHVVSARSLAGLGVGARLLTMLQVVPMWLRLFVWPVHLQVDYAPGELPAYSSFGLHEAAGLVLVIAALCIISVARRRAPVLSFGLAWCAVSLLPVSNIVPTGILLAERTLFLPSVGFVVAVGALGQAVLRRWTNARLRQVVVAACVVMVLLGVARSSSRHSVWNSAHVVIVKRAVAR
ncbi:MAG: glycosyltransferase family 39 protein [bacterium]